MAIEDTVEVTSRREEFTAFAQEAQERLRHALVAGYGLEAGREATADALIYGWLHWEKIRAMDNPVGYLYRVGQRKAKRRGPRREVALPELPEHQPLRIEPRLPKALRTLSLRQRVVVVLVHAYGLSHREAADMLSISRGTVQRHLERGLARLRSELGVEDA